MPDLVIDGGSCTNVASITLIGKVRLPTKLHPTPYSLQSFKQRSEVTIYKQALIVVLVGLYCGEVLCNGLPMNACHLLLGRPWLFDNHVIYDGYANTYSLKHNGYLHRTSQC